MEILALLINIISIICFTVLAIHFEKWWIVLFAYFFIFSVRITKEKQND